MNQTAIIPVGVKTSKLITAWGHATLGKPTLPVEKKNPVSNVPWARSGDDNLFINTVAKHITRSGTNNAIIRSKTDYVIGQGFLIERTDGKPYKKGENQKLEDWMDKINTKGETLLTVITKFSFDYIGM